MFRAVFRKKKYVGEKHRSSKIDLPLFVELGQTSQDSFVSGPISPRSRDVCPNSMKSGKSILKFGLWLTYCFVKSWISAWYTSYKSWILIKNTSIFYGFSLKTIWNLRNFEILRVPCQRSRPELSNGMKIILNGANLDPRRLVASLSYIFNFFNLL